MFLRETTRPEAGAHVLQRFGLADTLEWIPNHRINEIREAKGDTSLGFDPVAKVLAKLPLEDRRSGRLHGLFRLLETKLVAERLDRLRLRPAAERAREGRQQAFRVTR